MQNLFVLSGCIFWCIADILNNNLVFHKIPDSKFISRREANKTLNIGDNYRYNILLTFYLVSINICRSSGEFRSSWWVTNFVPSLTVEFLITFFPLPELILAIVAPGLDCNSKLSRSILNVRIHVSLDW